MPSTKRKQTYDRSDSFVASDPDSPPPQSTNNSTIHPSKRSKPGAAEKSFTTASSLPHGQQQTDTEGNPYWAISTARRVTVSDFKGKKMVSIREYYEKDGSWLPGKKGITMTLEQYGELVKVLPQIERVLGKEGKAVGRPDYRERNGGGHEGGENEVGLDDGDGDDGGDDGEGDGREGKKANIEATSDEDED